MKKIIGYILLGLVAYAGFVVVTFPAQRAVSMLQEQVPQLRVAGVSGTAWEGRMSTLQYQGQNFQRLKWSFNPFSIVKGRAEFDISFSGDGRSAKTALGIRSDGALVFSDLQAKLPVADIDEHLGIPGVELSGLVELQLQELVLLDNTLLSAEGDVFWKQAGVDAPVAQVLGDYSAALTTDEGGVKAQVKDDGGPLEIEGLAVLNDTGYSLNVTASVRDTEAKMLQQGLNMIGTPEGDGRYALQFSGKL